MPRTGSRAGRLRALVATSSLELGIDIGHVDLVCQLGSPRRISTFLQRVGRSGHTVHGTPKGRLFPLTLDELVESAALLRSVRHGRAGPYHGQGALSRRAGPADRRRDCCRGMEDRRALRFCATVQALSRPAPRGLRCGREDAGGRLRHPSRATGRADSSRRGQPSHPGTPRSPAHGADVGGRHPRQRGLSRHSRARRHLHRHGQRGFRHREHGGRHLPAGQHVVADAPDRAGNRAGRGRPGVSRPAFPSGWARPRPGVPSFRARSRSSGTS